MPDKMTITIADPVLAKDLRVLAEITKESTDAFVSRVLKIAIDAAVEKGRRMIAKEAKRKG